LYKKYAISRGRGKGPTFRHMDGTGITRTKLASKLRDYLLEIGHTPTKYNTHSFRIGKATDMARAGYSHTQIAMVGRWKSDAFLKYIKPSFIYCG
jgi:hypothetical protein